MSADKLARMANQIADFFRSYPEKEAVEGIRSHIASFWTPSMRRSLMLHVDQGGEGVDPLVRLALRGGQDRVAEAGGLTGSRASQP